MPKNGYYVGLCLYGEELPSDDMLIALLGNDVRIRRRGQQRASGKLYPHNVASVSLAEWQALTEEEHQEGDKQLASATELLRQLTPALRSLDSKHLEKIIRIDVDCYHPQAGFDLPADFVAVVGDAGFMIIVSMLFEPDDDQNDNGDDPAPSRSDGNDQTLDVTGVVE